MPGLPHNGWFPNASDSTTAPVEQTLYKDGVAVGKIIQQPDGNWATYTLPDGPKPLGDIVFNREVAVAMVEEHFGVNPGQDKKVAPKL